jgi:hypothetical protein
MFQSTWLLRVFFTDLIIKKGFTQTVTQRADMSMPA